MEPSPNTPGDAPPDGGPGTAREITVVLVEDDPRDAERVVARLTAEGMVCRAVRVDDREGLDQALAQGDVDVILSDYALRSFNGFAALDVARARCPDVPFVFVSGAIGEERAIEVLRRGATDYVLKHRLEHLGPAVHRALREAEDRVERRRAVARAERLQVLAAALADARSPAEVAGVAVAQGIEALDATAGCCWILAPDGRTLEIARQTGHSQAWVEQFGRVALAADLPVAATLRDGAPVWRESRVDDPGHSPVGDPSATAGDGFAAAFLPLAVEGRRVGALAITFDRPRRFSGDERALLVALARQCVQALDRALLDAAERDASRRFALLARASEVLSASLDYETTLQAVGGLAMPWLADYGFFDVVEDDGSVRRIARAYEDPATETRLAASHWERCDRTEANLCALSTGRSGFHPNTDDAWRQEVASSPEDLARLRARNFRSMITVPLQSHGVTLGALTLLFGRSGRHHTVADLRLAEELAHRAAVAVQNARLYRSMHQAEGRARDAARRLQILAEASHAFASAGLDLQTAFGTVVTFVGNITGDGCALSLLTPDGAQVATVAVHHPDPAASELMRAMLARPYNLGEGLLGRVARDGVAILLPASDFGDIPPEARRETHTFFGTVRPHSLVLVPLRQRDRVLGTLCIIRDRPGPGYGSDDLTLAQDLADRAALAIENGQLYAAAQASQQRSAYLAEATESLAASLDIAATLKQVAALAVPRIADMAGLYLIEPDRSVRQAAVAHVDPAMEPLLWELNALVPLHMDQDRLLPRAVLAGEPVLVSEVPDSVRAGWGPTTRAGEITRTLGIRSYMVVPFVVRGRVLGALALSTLGAGRRLEPVDLALALELARRASVAIENAELYREAWEANRLKDEFLATMSHELRTPLTAVLGWTRMLRTGIVPEARREHALETIERNAAAQARLIEDLLDISRIGTGKVLLRAEPVDPARVVEAALEAMRPAADAKGVRLVTSIESAPRTVQADPDRLQQVVTNLLSNAVKFTPPGGEVRTRLRWADAQVEIVVEDTGKGISAVFLPHVFERFRQADGSTTRTQGGLGLGLAIVRHLVDLHGGTVEALSEGEGRGATFVVRLPVAAPSPTVPAEGAEKSSGVSQPAVGSRLAGLRVLLVEDDADARELFVSILANDGATVEAVASVHEALAAFVRAAPDVLVSDLGMADQDGYVLIRRIRALPTDAGGGVPAVALTAYAGDEDVAKAKTAGFQVHVAKPVDPDRLVSVVAELAGPR